MLTTRDFAPYFMNGLLYVPEKTVEMLISAGLERETGLAALDGLSLDEKERLAEISHALENLLTRMAHSSEAFQELASDEVSFILTGKPSRPSALSN
jgi:hypothetical protein